MSSKQDPVWLLGECFHWIWGKNQKGAAGGFFWGPGGAVGDQSWCCSEEKAAGAGVGEDIERGDPSVGM